MSARRARSRSACRPIRAGAATSIRIARMVALTGVDGVRHHRDRGRGAAARSQPDQAAQAALQRAAARRQELPLHPHRRRPRGAAADEASRRAHRSRATISAPSPAPARSNRTLNALQRAFLLRSCSDSVYDNRTRPCLLYQIKRCSAPCTGEIAPADYAELVDEARDFLSGKSRAMPQRLAREMSEAAEKLEFERAAPLARPHLGAVGDPGRAERQPALGRGGRRLRHRRGGGPDLHPGVLLPRRPELGQPRLFPARRPRARGGGGARRLPRPVLRRQAGAAAGAAQPRRRRRASCLREVLERARRRNASTSARRSAARRRSWSTTRCATRARRWARKLAESGEPGEAARQRSPRPSASKRRRAGSRSTTIATSWAPTRSAR